MGNKTKNQTQILWLKDLCLTTLLKYDTPQKESNDYKSYYVLTFGKISRGFYSEHAITRLIPAD